MYINYIQREISAMKLRCYNYYHTNKERSYDFLFSSGRLEAELLYTHDL